jgi:hypothetical protein
VPALRLTVSAVLGAAGIVLGMVSPAVAASAAPNITILSAGPDGSGDPYNLTIVADDGNGLPIQTMTAYVENATTDVPPVTMTAQSVSNPASQTWVASPAITPATMPAGTYTVTVDVTDGTESDTGLAAGSFSFAYATSSLTATAAPASVTQGSQNVTFSGQLTGTASGGTPVGIANAPVDLSGAASNPVATTDANGDFSYAASGVQPGSYTFSVAADSGAYPAASATVTVSAQQATTSMTVSPSPASVTEGMQAVTFSGTVSAGSGLPVYLSIGSGTPTQVTETGASGDFSYLATDVQPGTYTFSVQQSPLGLYSAASASTTVSAVAAPTTVTVSPSPAFVTFGSPNVAFSGTVTALPEGSSTAVGIPDAPVYLNGSASPVATTDANGNFSYDATGVTQDTIETFSVPASSAGLYSSGSDAVPINVDAGTSAMTVTANPPDINLATSTVTFTGTVSVTPYAPAGSPTPSSDGVGSGIPVYLSVGGATPTQVTTTDDANGDFSYTATDVTQAADYDFTVKSATYFTAASESVPIGQNQVESTLTVTPAPASVTEGSQTVTFSGQLTGVSPSGGSPVAVQKAPVDLSINGGTATQVTTTDASGDFTYTATEISQKSTYDFSVANSPNDYTQATDDITVAVDQAQTRITVVSVTPPHLKYGQNATLKATVQYLNGQTWTALPDTAVHLSESATKLPTVTTTSAGTFTATLPSTHGPGWTAVVDAANLTLQAQATGNLTIALPLKFVSFSARLGVNKKLTASGCLEVITPEHDQPPGTFVDIQYSSRSRGPWRSLGTLALENDSDRVRTCRSHDQSYFSGAIPAKLVNAYYRAYFAATDSFQSQHSSPVHAWKYPTRIVSFTASKHTITSNGTVRFKGRLEAKGKSWRGYGRQPIEILQGTQYLTTVTSNSRGYFTALIGGPKKPESFTVTTYAMYPGNATHLECLSKGIAVKVTAHGSDVVAAPAGSTGSSAPPSLAQLERLPAPAVPMLPEFVVWPSIASLARIDS